MGFTCEEFSVLYERKKIQKGVLNDLAELFSQSPTVGHTLNALSKGKKEAHVTWQANVSIFLFSFLSHVLKFGIFLVF